MDRPLLQPHVGFRLSLGFDETDHFRGVAFVGQKTYQTNGD
jgi:hypothetical protein